MSVFYYQLPTFALILPMRFSTALLVDVAFDIGASAISEYKALWDSFVDERNLVASDTANRAWHTAQAWVMAEAELAIINSTIVTIVVAAVRTRKDLTETQKAALDEVMKDEAEVGKEVLISYRDSPPEMKRKSLIDFTRFERVFGRRNSGEVPMTECAFSKHCENTLGLTDEEMTEWWKEPQDDISNRSEKENFVENRLVEGSGDIKAPNSSPLKPTKRF
ncbi:unnamed protein product [Symbiodinium natans]|uniref:Uncharacterized protein n=1 Tax=Symbiodinium natans TaxID=878477 RepID=A0A812NAZ2_9DINO|nr:unnamed protein product [Symbiodinium natans]